MLLWETPDLGQRKPQVSRPHHLSKGHLEAQGHCGSELPVPPEGGRLYSQGQLTYSQAEQNTGELKLPGDLPCSGPETGFTGPTLWGLTGARIPQVSRRPWLRLWHPAPREREPELNVQAGTGT